jgi:DNA-binding SARP family transcriptional activator/pSer/pThr/pTyr-binding forkhead associated (FHA) protein
MADFRVLGELEVLSAGRKMEIAGRRLTPLLALLVVDANRTVSIDRIIEEVWADDRGHLHPTALRVRISGLRKALDAVGLRDRLLTRPGGYQFVLRPKELDADRFEAGLREARMALSLGDYHRAAKHFRSADALWRGPAFGELGIHPFARPTATRLEEMRVCAIEDRLVADLACGRHGEVLGELEALVVEHPLRERIWACRMLALYRSGRQSEALRTYQQLRTLLGEELGLEPGADVRLLESAIIRQDATLEWVASPVVEASAVEPAAATTDAYLVVGPDEDEPRLIPILDRFFVGRDCAGTEERRRFIVDDPSVSRHHFEILIEGDAAWLLDVSTNGTLLNGIRVERAERVPLRDGDLISLGPTELGFRWGGGSAQPPPVSTARRVERHTVVVVAGGMIVPRGLIDDALDARAVEALDRLLADLRATLRAHGGTLDTQSGDALVARFDPRSRVRAAEDAVRFALAADAIVAAAPNDLIGRLPDGVALAMGFGVAVGEVIAGLPTRALLQFAGDPGDLAFRLAAAAGRFGRASVLVTDEVRNDVSGSFAFAPPVRLDSHGDAAPLRAHGVLGAAGAYSAVTT